MDFEPLRGGCACTATRYLLTRPPMLVHCCHCLQCQRSSGSAFALNAIIENDAIDVISGDLEAHYGQTEDPGKRHDVYRCRQCQTALWADYGRRPNYRFVKVGTLYDPAACPPDVHIFMATKLPWVQVPADVPQFDGFYERLEDVWPPEALARRRAATG